MVGWEVEVEHRDGRPKDGHAEQIIGMSGEVSSWNQ